MRIHPLALAVNQALPEMWSIRYGMVVQGSKGGSKQDTPRAPVESPDSLASIAYANVLDLVSEGEIEGLVNGLESVYLNETPVQSSDGRINFPGINVQTRNGTQGQAYIQGFPAVESEVSVNYELKYGLPWTKAITNVQLSAVRIRLSTPRMTEQNSTTGDTTGSYVAYAINVKAGSGAYVNVVNTAFNGKTTTLYERTHRIDLPPSTDGWTIQVFRLTPDSESGLIANSTNVVSITEVIDAKFRYPNSALVGMKFDSSQFAQTPTRAFHLRGVRVKVPTNYDPVLRTYSGVWNGTFKVAYTNNPAWIYYDLVLSDRYGLGHMIKSYQVDRYELYRVSQYCDQMVSDGKGGLEPRFTCNLYLQQRADALKVIQDIAAIFRGMSYWGASQVFVTSDMPEDPTYTYTNANVIDGNFDYQGTGGKSRYSVALVSWCDPNDFYRAKVEYVEDRDQLAIFGHRQTEIAGIGCTSQAQAQRLGRWMLLTNKLETDTVNFAVGLDGVLVRPGKIVRIADNQLAGRRIGGRIRAATINTMTLDSNVTVYAGDTITAIMPDGTAVSRVVTNTAAPITWDNTGVLFSSTSPTWDATSAPVAVQVVTVSPNFPAIPVEHSIWAVDSTTLATQQFRILSIEEDFSGENMQFKITATKHVMGKFDAVDSGTRIEQPPITIIPPSTQPPPTNVTLTSDWSTSQGIVNTKMTIKWDAAPNAVAYEVEWRFNNGNWIYAGRTGTTSIDVIGILAGRFQARVQAFNANDLGSVWATSIEYALEGKTEPPPTVSSLTTESIVFGIRVKWGFPNGVTKDTTQRTEIWYGLTNDLGQATKQGDYAYPQDAMAIMGLHPSSEFYFWARLVDRVGNVGAYYGPVFGKAEQNASVILDYLTAQITATQLHQTLNDRIPLPGELDDIDARIDDVVQTHTDDTSAMTSQINTATSTANGAAAQAQTAMTTATNTNGQLAAMYTIKTQISVNGRTYLAGIGVGVENTNGIIESQVLIAASRFAVMDPNVGVVRYPFVIVGGIAYMDTAFIQDATITTAKIADAQITYGKIAFAQIGEAHIINGQITNAKIGDLAVNTLKIAGRSITIPASVYTEGQVTCPGALNVQNWTAVQGLGVTGTGWEAMMTFTAMVSMNTAAGYWRIRRSDGAILASGQIGYSSQTFNTPSVSLCISIMTAAVGYYAYYLDIAPWSNNLTFHTTYVANRGITYLEVMR